MKSWHFKLLRGAHYRLHSRQQVIARSESDEAISKRDCHALWARNDTFFVVPNLTYSMLSAMILGPILIILLFTQPGFAQTSEEFRGLKKELDELKQSQMAIQKDLQEIKNLLRSMGVLPEEPKNLFFNIAGKPFTGDKNARLTLIEFSEYQ
jgi:hypothetical protein